MGGGRPEVGRLLFPSSEILLMPIRSTDRPPSSSAKTNFLLQHFCVYLNWDAEKRQKKISSRNKKKKKLIEAAEGYTTVSFHPIFNMFLNHFGWYM